MILARYAVRTNGVRPLVRLYASIERLRRRFVAKVAGAAEVVTSLVMATYRGLWLGLFDRDELGSLTQAFYDRGTGSDRWDRNEYLDSGLHGWERDFADRLAPGTRLLIPCAGAGREAFAFARRGCEVTAFDCAPSLVRSARAFAATNGLDVRFADSEPDEVPHLGTFDAAIVGWCGYIHIIGRDARLAFLRGIRSQLEPNAPLLVSFTNRPPSSRRFKITPASPASSGGYGGNRSRN